MERAYKKECWSTLIAFGVVTLLTHIFPVYFLFPEFTQMMWFGFPAHYLFTIVVGWLVLIPLYWLFINISEKIDREIEETSGRAAELDEIEKIRSGAAEGGLAE